MSKTTKATYLGIFCFLNLFIYFGIQSLITVNEYNFLTTLDQSIPFIPEFVWIYHSLIPILFITMCLFITKKKTFFSVLGALILATGILSLFHVFFPSFYPRQPLNNIDTSSIWLVEITRLIDGPHNTFPSGHVAFSWILTMFIGTANFIQKKKWLKSFYYIWAILISFSTLALKQHYLYDVISGIILAIICYILIKKLAFRHTLQSI